MEDYDDVSIGPKKYRQYKKDSEGREPNLKPGTRVNLFGEDGTVLLQRLHFDCGESFFGNVIVEMDSGGFVESHCWQCRAKEDG